MQFLYTCGPEITEATFVINGGAPQELFDFVQRYAPKHIKVSCVSRPNVGFSYGAWNDVIYKNIKNGNKHDYYFMIEDDYIPKRPDFYKPFVDACTDNTPFVCSWISMSYRKHAGISNGIIQGKACERVIEKHNKLFNIIGDDRSEYADAYATQTKYYSYFHELNYDLTDISDKYYIPFHESSNDSIINYGKLDGETLIGPIL